MPRTRRRRGEIGIGYVQCPQATRKLEAQLTDRGGYAPHSEAWMEHWGGKLDQFLTKGDADAIKGMPLAYIDDRLAKADREARQNEISGQTTSPD